MNNANVTVVTVTYGRREALLDEMLRRVIESEHIANIVVVDNGADWSVGDQIRNLADSRIKLTVAIGGNGGTAAAFSEGITFARRLGSTYIWLLDDDNMVYSDTVDKLLLAYENKQMNTSCEKLAILSYRKSHHDGIMTASSHGKYRSSFLGFNFLEMPNKIIQKTFGRMKSQSIINLNCISDKLIRVNYATYGGLLFQSKIIDDIGLPDKRLYSYADDTEFTYRITKSGGEIYIVTDAPIIDRELSWNKHNIGIASLGWLVGDGDARAYYSVRNNTYFDYHILPVRKNKFLLNKIFYLFILKMLSIPCGRKKRYHIIKEAVDDGISKNLGFNAKYRM